MVLIIFLHSWFSTDAYTGAYMWQEVLGISRSFLDDLALLGWAKRPNDFAYKAKNVTDLFTLLINGLLQLVNKLQQTCQFHQVATSLLKSDLLQLVLCRQWRTLGGGGGRRRAQAPPIIFTEALILKSGSTRKFFFKKWNRCLLFSTLFCSFT